MSHEVKVETEKVENQTHGSEDTIKEEVVVMAKNTFPFDIETTGNELVPIHAQKFEITLGEVLVDDLKLDKTNQRLDWRLVSKNITNPTQDDLVRLIWEDLDYIRDLKKSIEVNGGLLEAIIVKNDGTVIEGNCRLTCYKKLAEDDPENELWERIRCRVLPGDVAEHQIQVLLGELHVAGKNTWVPLEEAGYVYRMFKGPGGFRLEDLATYMRCSRTTIQHMIAAYTLMTEHYLPKYIEPHRIHHYSYFFEFYKHRKKYPKVYQEDLLVFRALEDEFVDWVGEGNIDKGQQVRDLPKILGNERALEALRTPIADGGGYLAAMTVLEEDNPEYSVSIYKVMARMVDLLKKVPLEELDQLRDGHAGRVRMVKDLKAQVDKFLEEAGIEV